MKITPAIVYCACPTLNLLFKIVSPFIYFYGHIQLLQDSRSIQSSICVPSMTASSMMSSYHWILKRFLLRLLFRGSHTQGLFLRTIFNTWHCNLHFSHYRKVKRISAPPKFSSYSTIDATFAKQIEEFFLAQVLQIVTLLWPIKLLLSGRGSTDHNRPSWSRPWSLIYC